MNYSFTDYLNNRFCDEIMEAAEECLCADNVRGLSARVTAVQIWQISTDVLLKYEDYAEFPVVISARVRTDEDGNTFCRNVYMRGLLSGTFSQYFDDFEISLTEILRHTPKRTLQKFSDDLLPRLTEDEMEEQANRLLFKVYKYTHTETRPQKISPAFIAHTLGMLMEQEVPAPGGQKKWYSRTIESILTNEKYKGSALLQKKFTVDFLTKKTKVNEGEVPQYFVEHSHPPIVDPEEFDMVQAEMVRRKEIGRTYSSSNIFSSRIICSCCGGYFGSKVWHSTSKYRRVIWQCNHKFNGERCKTPHFYEDAIKEKFVIACKSVFENREDFLAACQQVRDILSDCTALERKVDELFVQQNEVNAILQAYIRENATKPQKQDEYNERYNEYAQKSDEIKKAIAAVQAKIARRLSRKELLDGMVRELETADLALTQFDEKLWRIMVEHVSVRLDGEMVFRFRNGMEVTVE